MSPAEARIEALIDMGLARLRTLLQERAAAERRFVDVGPASPIAKGNLIRTRETLREVEALIATRSVARYTAPGSQSGT